jgi:hypothetical protein
MVEAADGAEDPGAWAPPSLRPGSGTAASRRSTRSARPRPPCGPGASGSCRPAHGSGRLGPDPPVSTTIVSTVASTAAIPRLPAVPKRHQRRCEDRRLVLAPSTLPPTGSLFCPPMPADARPGCASCAASASAAAISVGSRSPRTGTSGAMRGPGAASVAGRGVSKRPRPGSPSSCSSPITRTSPDRRLTGSSPAHVCAYPLVGAGSKMYGGRCPQPTYSTNSAAGAAVNPSGVRAPCALDCRAWAALGSLVGRQGSRIASPAPVGSGQAGRGRPRPGWPQRRAPGAVRRCHAGGAATARSRPRPRRRYGLRELRTDPRLREDFSFPVRHGITGKFPRPGCTGPRRASRGPDLPAGSQPGRERATLASESCQPKVIPSICASPSPIFG